VQIRESVEPQTYCWSNSKLRSGRLHGAGLELFAPHESCMPVIERLIDTRPEAIPEAAESFIRRIFGATVVEQFQAFRQVEVSLALGCFLISEVAQNTSPLLVARRYQVDYPITIAGWHQDA
jgi:hypothetical protein